MKTYSVMVVDPSYNADWIADFDTLEEAETLVETLLLTIKEDQEIVIEVENW